MKNRKDAVELGAQLAYEYENVDCEQIEAMLATYEDETPPCDFDELYDIVVEMVKLRAKHLSFTDAVDQLVNP